MARRRVHVKKLTRAQHQARQLKQEQDRALADAWMREHPGARMVIYAISFALVVFVFIAVWSGVQSVNAGVSSTPTPTVDTSASLQAASGPTQDVTAKPTVKTTPPPIITAKAQPTHRITPTSTPTPTHPPACKAANGNPWCYSFSPGNLITKPPGNFCTYFNCIGNFVGADDPDGGYVVECSDATFSQSGGERGACAHHGGEMRPLYSH
jgi:hypothetical protein